MVVIVNSASESVSCHMKRAGSAVPKHRAEVTIDFSCELPLVQLVSLSHSFDVATGCIRKVSLLFCASSRPNAPLHCDDNIAIQPCRSGTFARCKKGRPVYI